MVATLATSVVIAMGFGFLNVVRPQYMARAPAGQDQESPCAHLEGTGRSVISEVGWGSGYTVEDYVRSVHAVAAVTVASVLPARFETVSGSPPPPAALPSAPPTGDWYDAVERFIEPDLSSVFEPVVVRVTKAYSGATSVDGYVVARLGGESPCPGHEFTAEGQILSGTIGTAGMALLLIPDETDWGWDADPPPIYEQLLRIVNELEAGGDNYEAAVPYAWWWYDGPTARTLLPHEPVSVTVLEGLVEDALR
jgi:hypothetical protein